MSSLSQSWVKSTNNDLSKKGSEPQHGQPCFRLLPSKSFIMEKWPKWLWVMTYRVPMNGLVKRREKMIYCCMPLFCCVFSLPFLPLSFFLSLNSYSLSFLLFSHRGFLPPSSMATSSFYSELIQWDFSLLSLRLHQLFLVSCGHFFKIAH